MQISSGAWYIINNLEILAEDYNVNLFLKTLDEALRYSQKI